MFDLFGRLPRSGVAPPPFDELIRVPICTWSGHRAGPDCPAIDSLYIPIPGLRTPVCPYHRTILVDVEERHRVGPGSGGHAVPWKVLPPAMEHYYARHDPTYRPLPAWSDLAGGDDQPMEVLYPEPGARLLIPTQLDGTRGQAIAEVAHRDPLAAVDWDLDGTYLGRTSGEHRMPLSPTDGPHLLTLTDPQGHVLRQRFTVVGPAGVRSHQ